MSETDAGRALRRTIALNMYQRALHALIGRVKNTAEVDDLVAALPTIGNITDPYVLDRDRFVAACDQIAEEAKNSQRPGEVIADGLLKYLEGAITAPEPQKP